jgi:uncharacterized membrane protein YphA (DoxX/SURF4 family)
VYRVAAVSYCFEITHLSWHRLHLAIASKSALDKRGELPMRRNTVLLAIRLLVALNFLPAIFFKLTGAPLSVALFTAVSNAFHGLVSQPVFRLGSGIVETVLVLLLLIPRTARLGAALIAVWMVGAILSHIFVLGYGLFFVSALATFFLSCLYLFLSRKQANSTDSDSSAAQVN